MKTKFYFTALLLLGYSWNITMGQSFNLEPATSLKPILGLKTSLPVIKESEGTSVKAMSGMYTLYSAIPVSDKWSLYAELPLIVSNFEGSDESETGLGNVFLTTRIALDEKRTSHISLGVFLPTISEEKYSLAFMGLLSNYYRASQVTSAYTIYGNYSFNTDREKNLILGGEVGPEILIPKNNEYGNAEVWFHFSLQAGYKIDNLALWAEFNDLIFASQLDEDIEFNERNINQLLFCGQYNFGMIRPGLCFMLPLKDELNDYQSGAIGVKVDVNF